MTAAAALRQIAALLHAAEIPDADFDARCLTEDFLHCRPLAAHAQDTVAPDDFARLLAAADRRCTGEPLQYILGEWEFFGLPFAVGRGVLIPRPDTEVLVETALAHLQGQTAPRVADLCSGSGCVAVAIAVHCPAASVTAVELSADARTYLAQNIARNGGTVAITAGDVLRAETAAQFAGLSCITCNPPYLSAADLTVLQREVQAEPLLALAGGTDGLDFYRRLPALWYPTLRDGGLLAFEIGAGQEQAVAAQLSAAGYREIQQRNDCTGTPRVVCGIR